MRNILFSTTRQWNIGDESIAARDSAIEERNLVAAERDSLLKTRSWKVTAPLRAVASFFRRLWKGAGRA